MKITQIMALMEEIAPARLAEEWDRVGLQTGDPDADAKRVLVGLTPCTSLLNEAVERSAQMVITHHPLLLKPLFSLTTQSPGERLVREFVRRDIAVFAAHTNYDSAQGGINDALASELQLTDVQPLTFARTALKKFVVFVPEEHLEQVSSAICDAGAGNIGDYRDCTFRTKGTGTFTPCGGAHPYIGQRGKLERVAEVRLESIVQAERVDAVLAAMRRAHPYEEPAFDVYPLDNRRNEPGLGRAGRLAEPMPAEEFVRFVAATLGNNAVRHSVIAPHGPTISTVAVCGGGGGDFWREAAARKCDAYVTGDVKYHTMVDAQESGLFIINAGHAETELPGVKALQRKLAERLPGVEVLLAQNGGVM